MLRLLVSIKIHIKITIKIWHEEKHIEHMKGTPLTSASGKVKSSNKMAPYLVCMCTTLHFNTL